MTPLGVRLKHCNIKNMNLSLSLFEILSLSISLVTTLALILAVRQIRINRQQLYLSTIAKCIEDFRKLGDIDKDTTDRKLLWKYIDLVSEELFYFQYDYIPQNVSIEWIDGMFDYLPVTDLNGAVLNSNNCIKILSREIDTFFISFPRIRNSFEIKGIYNFSIIYSEDKDKIKDRIIERIKLAKEILSNVKR